MENEFTVKPIGIVRSEYKKPSDLHFACREGRNARTVSDIVINDEFSCGLEGLSEFSHIWVMFLLHEAKRIEMKTYPGPKSISGLELKGIFATRSQYRPNHIALRLVKLTGINGNVVTVESLDAIDGSRVIDIKPFITHFDLPEKICEPDWCRWQG